jgi:hypothetical protein
MTKWYILYSESRLKLYKFRIKCHKWHIFYYSVLYMISSGPLFDSCIQISLQQVWIQHMCMHANVYYLNNATCICLPLPTAYQIWMNDNIKLMNHSRLYVRAWSLRCAKDRPWSIFVIPIDENNCQIINAKSL